MHIHIASCGKDSGGIKECIRMIPAVDKIYFLYSKTPSGDIENTAEELCDIYSKANYECEKMLIDSFDFKDIEKKIYQIYNKEHGKGVQFSINITRGTNIVAAAACSTALFIGSRIYYMKGKTIIEGPEELIEIPVPKMPDVKSIKGPIKDLLRYILERTEEGEEFINRGDIERKFESSPSLTGYRLGVLEKSGLIKIEIDPQSKRNKIVKLTKEGKVVADWLA